MKNILFIALIGLFIIGCGSPSSHQTSVDENLAEIFTPANFAEKAAAYVDQTVSVKGVIDHVCSHDGKKMFLVDMEAPGRVRVNTGDDMAAFRTEWEGSEVIATGIVVEFVIDEAYLIEWEEELKAEAEQGEEEEGHEACEYESYTASSGYKQILRYREMMAEKETNKLSFYSMKATAYQILED